MNEPAPHCGPRRVALITGANVGIGRVSALELAKVGYRIVIAGRSELRTQAVIDQINALGSGPPAVFLPLDLASMASVRECAQRFLAMQTPLHLLVNNAGVAGLRGLTDDGFEMMFGINHLGHFLLTQKLLPRLLESGASRIVTVSSRAHKRAQGIDWAALQQPTRSLTGVHEYAVSKLANLLFSAELARRLKGTEVSSYALHPGVVDTEIWRAVPGWLRPLLRLRGMISAEEGALTTLHCALHATVSESGLYFSQSRPTLPSPCGQDLDMARQLWARSEAWVV